MELLNNLSKNTKIVHCPFNAAHTMPLKTLELHLLKCPERPKNFKNCFFNNLHVMHESELDKHHENCPNRILMDQYLYQSEDTVRPKIQMSDEPPPNEDEEESWDQPAGNKINVIKAIRQTSNIFKPVSGLTKSQRKKNREQAQNFSDVDLSFNQHITMNERLTSASGNSSKPPPKQINEKNLFYGYVNKPPKS